MILYMYDNKPIEVETKESIESIHVKVISGDEIVTINGKNTYDPGKPKRLVNYFDGEYDITDPIKIERWLNFKPKKKSCTDYSYQRWEEFSKC